MEYSIAKMKKLIFISLSLFISTSVFSQDLPKPLAEILQKNKFILKNSDLNAEQQSYLWAGKSMDRAGYLTVRADPDYVELVNSMMSHKLFAKRPKAQDRSGIALYGELNEGQHRATRIYNVEKVQVAITTFNYRAAGATVSIIDEFINQRVLDSPATLSLVVPLDKGIRKGLWKLTIWTDDKIFEIYLPDKLNNDQYPSHSVQSVMTLAEELIQADANE